MCVILNLHLNSSFTHFSVGYDHSRRPFPSLQGGGYHVLVADAERSKESAQRSEHKEH